MIVHTTNYTRRPDNSTHRIKSDHKGTTEFKVVRAGSESGIAVQAKYGRFILDVELSPEETQILIESLIKK